MNDSATVGNLAFQGAGNDSLAKILLTNKLGAYGGDNEASVLFQAGKNVGQFNGVLATTGTVALIFDTTNGGDLKIGALTSQSAGTTGQVITSNGPGLAPTWETPAGGSTGISRWNFADFYSTQATSNSPFVGISVSSGSTNGALQPQSLVATGAGWVGLRSSSTANSGYRWDTQSANTWINEGMKFQCIFNTYNTVTTLADRQAWFGWKNNTMNIASPSNGVYFHLDGNTLAPVLVRNSTPVSPSPASVTLTDDTTYMVEITINSDTSMDYDLFAAPTGGTSKGTIIQSWTLTTGTAFNANVVCRAGMAAVHETGETNKFLLALDYMALGYP
jgi:hypothetical protein